MSLAEITGAARLLAVIADPSRRRARRGVHTGVPMLTSQLALVLDFRGA